MAAHTPGPWDAEGYSEEHRGYLVRAAQGDYTANCGGPDGDPEAEANARLIAAAPDLYGAVAAAFAMYGDPRWAHELLELEHLSDDDRAEAQAAVTVAEGLRAVLAKATGGAS